MELPTLNLRRVSYPQLGFFNFSRMRITYFKEISTNLLDSETPESFSAGNVEEG